MAEFDPDSYLKSAPAFDPDAYLKSEPQSGQGYDIAASGAAGAGRGISNFLGAAGDLRGLASRATDAAGAAVGLDPAKVQRAKDMVSAAAGLTGPGRALLAGPTSEQVRHGIEGVTGEFHKPETTAGRYTQAATEVAANPASYLGPGGLGAKALMAGASGLGAEAGADLTAGTGFEPVGRIGGALIGGPLAARAIKPSLAAPQQMLADAGVTQMTPGQLAGGMLKSAEDKLASIPILGSFIKSSQGRSIESFNKAVANQALEPIGEKLASRTQAGHEAVAEVERKLSNKYDQLVPQLHFIPDHDFANDYAALKQSAATMPASYNRLFNRILADRLHPDRWVSQQLLPANAANPNNVPALYNAPIWGLQGKQFKSIESELTNLAGKYGKSSDAGQQMLGEHLGDVVKAMRANIERMNPAHAAELADINKGWAMYARMRTAAQNRATSEGVFTPGDLLAAVKRGDRTAGRGSFAKGDALMQDFAEAGQRVLPSKIPNSGTFDRMAMAGIPAGAAYLAHNPAVAAAGAAAIAPYTRPSMYLLNKYAAPTSGPRTAYRAAGEGAGLLRPFATAPNVLGPYSP